MYPVLIDLGSITRNKTDDRMAHIHTLTTKQTYNTGFSFQTSACVGAWILIKCIQKCYRGYLPMLASIAPLLYSLIWSCLIGQ